MSDVEMNAEFEDFEEDSDVPSDVDWSDNDDPADGPKYTNPRGTIVWPESEAKTIPILGDDHMKSGESFGGLQLHVLSKSRRYENTWRRPHRMFKNSKEIKLRIPIRTQPYMTNESDILVTEGESSYISVWAGLKIPSGLNFPSSVVSANGIAVADPMAFTWKPAEDLPWWMTAWEIKNAMGFMRMTTYFNMLPEYEKDQSVSLTCPGTGNYAFHILIIIPKSATQLRKKFSSSLGLGGYLQRDGKRYCFNGYFVGMLNTNFLQECAVHIQIPVIIPREIFQLDGQGGSTGMFGSANLSPSKPKMPQTPTKNGQPSSSNGLPASPTPADNKNAKIKAQMKKRLQAGAPSKRNTQSSSGPSTQDTVGGNEGGSSGTALAAVNPGTGSTDEVPQVTGAGFDGAGTGPPAESTGVAPAASEDHAAPSTAKDKGKGKAVADDERLGDAVGANSTQGGRKKGRRN
ncbi:hypothetical protein INS49_014984 [Diaporthe citri]|uniref:uncharacterized protein n=1 Tax=Diaporthe citri TaxID=83186 RepID=UPI001C7EBB60|nr:uncharacterized protein INS49_014984 [Diaporthe citri]KAG6357107.1 hypothetical protein INS49_014984 [Diaporthe citri]